MKTRRQFMIAGALMAAGALLTFGLSLARAEEQNAQTKQEVQKAQLMFVQTADDIRTDDKTLRLVNFGKQTLYFSDRPVRIAGHIAMPIYLDEWKAEEGPDNFSKDPPNATLSVYEPGHSENTLAVVEISHPVVDGNDLVYEYRLIEGTMPKAGGATALFIDWIGVGGGVGAGFHGVGVGERGPGVTFHGVGVGFRGPGWR